MAPEELLQRCNKVTLANQPLFEKYFRAFPSEISEMTFANMFLWSDLFHIRFCEYREHFLVAYQKPHWPLTWYPPIGPHPEEIILRHCPPSDGFVWTLLDGKLASKLQPALSPVLLRERCDYVYRTSDIIDLPGDKYAHKRNYIKRCMAQKPESFPLTPEAGDECLSLLDRWTNERKNASDPGIVIERAAILRAFQHYEALGLTGIGIRFHGTLEAFAIGVPLTKNMIAEEFEKADRNFKGLYQYVFHEFARLLPPEITFINKEADSGIPGLRAAKEDWHPAYLVDKYSTASLSSESALH